MTVDRVIVGSVGDYSTKCIFCDNINNCRSNEFLYVLDKHYDRTYYICKYCARQISAQYNTDLRF